MSTDVSNLMMVDNLVVDNLMVEGNEEEETGSLYIFWEGNRGLVKMWLRK